MIISDKTIKNLEDDISKLIIDFKNINCISIKNDFSKLEYLSLRNNNLIDLNFIIFLPSIWYLDIQNNPVDNYDIFNNVNTFGYLGLSIEKYS